MRRLVLLLLLLTALAGAAILLARPGAEADSATFTVDSTGDGGDSNTADGVCDDGSGNCTLRAAIEQANADAGTDTIAFDITGAGPHTISPGSALPTITDPLIIDGTSEPDFSGTPIVELDGTNAGAGVNGLTITAGSSTAKGLVINRFNGDGIELSGSGGNTIEGNYIGIDVNGTADLGNSLDGVYINGAPNNTIGGTTEEARNVISGNNLYGVHMAGSGATGNQVQGNYIGTDKGGSADLGNSWFGVYITDAPSNTIGGTAAGARNVISGNNTDGVLIAATGNQVQGNYIGTDVNGTADLGNSWSGVHIGSVPNNTIGGTTEEARNVISGNGHYGVLVHDSGATGNQIQGNYIGTDVTGSVDLGNSWDGVYINGAPGNTIGGTVAGARNLISGNDQRGVYISASNATGNLVQGNYIGTDVNGSADLGNSDYGVHISSAPSNTIGGTSAGARNVISGNDTDGVYIAGSGATGNLVQGNYIGTDVTGTADLGNSDYGVYISGPASNNTIGGTTAGARNVIAGNNSHGVYISASNATGNQIQGNYIGTDKNGTAALANSSCGVYISSAPGNIIGGTTAGAGNVISGNNWSGVAIIGSSATGNQVQGNYIGTDVNGTADLGNSDYGVHIDSASSNTIGGTAAGARNVISGNDQYGVYIGGGATGNQVQGNYIGTDVTGTADLGNSGAGVYILGSTNTVGGTTEAARNVISGNGGQGVEISNSGATGNVVQGNYIGTDKNGTADLGNSSCGVYIIGAPANTVGGTTEGARNVISANDWQGVFISGSGATGNQVQGNFIGTDKNGTADLGNSNYGVRINDTPSNTIGGTAAGAGNVISGNGGGVYISAATGNEVQGNYIGTDVTGTAAIANGIGVLMGAAALNNTIGGTAAGAGNVISGNDVMAVMMNYSSATGNQVQGNLIGTQVDGTTPLGNGSHGVVITDDAHDNTIGGPASGAGNTIAHSGGDGVLVAGATTTGNTISGNSIHTNDLRGIENMNGGNTELAPPIVDSVGSVSGHTEPKCYPCTVEVFSDDDAEGRIYEGSVSTNDDENGSWLFAGSVSGPHVTATVTDAGGNTSELWGDADGDELHVDVDNCPDVYNLDQDNSDADSHGDACDNCPYDDNEDQTNSDTDSHGDACDNCPSDDNENQADTDSDGAGDVCDICAGDPDDDADNDGICVGSGYLPPKTGDNDNCALIVNPLQDNHDDDTAGDACDCDDDNGGTPDNQEILRDGTDPFDPEDDEALDTNDDDSDGGLNWEEDWCGTDPNDACGDDCDPNPPYGTHDAWLFDLNIDCWVNSSDVIAFSQNINMPIQQGVINPKPFQCRYDLNGDEWINSSDIIRFSQRLSMPTSCTNP